MTLMVIDQYMQQKVTINATYDPWSRLAMNDNNSLST